MTIARKDYKCDLCGEQIPKGSDYHRADVQPWNCAGGDPGFYTWHEHHYCHQIWAAMAEEYDYLMPTGAGEWREMVEYWGHRQPLPADGFKPDDVAAVWRNFTHWFPGTAGRIGTVVEVKDLDGEEKHVMVKFPNEEKPYAHWPAELALLMRPDKTAPVEQPA